MFNLPRSGKGRMYMVQCSSRTWPWTPSTMKDLADFVSFLAGPLYLNGKKLGISCVFFPTQIQLRKALSWGVCSVWVFMGAEVSLWRLGPFIVELMGWIMLDSFARGQTGHSCQFIQKYRKATSDLKMNRFGFPANCRFAGQRFDL